MKKIVIPLIGLITALSLLGHRIYTAKKPLSFPDQAYVADVIDGDTIQLRSGQFVRYIGIDTPEIHKKSGDEWVEDPETMSREAKQLNEKLVLHKTITIEYDAEKIDKYDRLLGYIYCNGIMANEKMLDQGLAFFLFMPPNDKYKDRLYAALTRAYTNNRGLWRIRGTPSIPADQAHEHVGSLAIVEGTILHVAQKSYATFLNFGDDYSTDFTGVIFKSAETLMPKEYSAARLHGSIVRLTGIIKEYNGPEIIINSPEQIQIVISP